MATRNICKNVLSVFLAAVLLFSVLPMSVSSQNDGSDEIASKIVREVTELREENVKHFLCEDGSYIAASYFEPVHYKENGVWKEIDNTLVLSETKAYVPRASNLDVSIPQSFDGGKQITLTGKGHTISFGITEKGQKVFTEIKAEIKNVEELASVATELQTEAHIDEATKSASKNSSVESYNQNKMTLEKRPGALVFGGIFPKADLEYIVSGNGIKESIVVSGPLESYVYSFDMNLGNLIPVARDDGSYLLTEKNNPDNTVFVLEAPYMYDANGIESFDVELSLTQIGNKYRLMLSANEEWINSSDRAFPVIIDPTITAYGEYNDVFVMNGVLYGNSPQVNNELRVGRNLTNTTRTYIKPIYPDIPPGSRVSNARITLIPKSIYQAPLQDDISISAYDCYTLPSWSHETVSWNNQPFGNSINSYQSYGISPKSPNPISDEIELSVFFITEAAQRYYDNGINNGIMLASSDENSKVQVDYYSSRASDYDPVVTVRYSEPYLSREIWQTTQEASTSPVVSVYTSANWTAAADESWVSLSSTSGSGNGSFRISVTENTSPYPRECDVTVMMGTVQLGKVHVEQAGTDPYLNTDKDEITFGYETGVETVAVTSNAEWDFEVTLIQTETESVPENESDLDPEPDPRDIEWLNVAKNMSGGLTLTVTKPNNNTTDTAVIEIVTDAGNLSKIITVTRLDAISYMFNDVRDAKTVYRRQSSDYHHRLAQWSMALSYAAYNPVSDEAISGIPGSFMQPPYDVGTQTAEKELIDMGFDATVYDSNAPAYTIGHKEIVISTKIEQTETGGNDSDSDIVVLSGDSTDESSFRSGNFFRDNLEYDSESVPKRTAESLGEAVLNNEDAESSDTYSYVKRDLVVVIVRGSVSKADWLMNAATQYNTKKDQFYDGMETVYESLQCNDECAECNGDGETCSCQICYKDDPIILITGHSLGAAVANLLATHLNGEKIVVESENQQTDVPEEGEDTSENTDEDDLVKGYENIYAYTFATPNVIDTAEEGQVPIRYDNIFNIMNTNDAVPLLPHVLLTLDFGENTWTRHGREFYITMPMDVSWLSGLDTAWFGLGGHAMPTYYTWINGLAQKLNKDPDDITTADMEILSHPDVAYGLLPLILKFKCPVAVTLYDGNGNTVAFESQEENAVYPELTESGIVSWITDEGEKIFVLPYGCETVDAHIEAYDYGTMRVTVEKLGIDEPLESKIYNNVNLYPGKEFELEIAEEFYAEDAALMELDENGTATEITDLNPLLKSVTVQNPVVTYGTPTTVTVVTDSSVSKVQFIHRDTGATITCAKDSPLVVGLVEDGDNLIWTIQRVYTSGHLVYDVGVKLGNTWYITENVFEITVNL